MTDKKLFSEASELKLTGEERSALKSLSHNKDFAILRRVVEDYTLKLTHNIAVGTELERGKRIEEMDKLAGFVYYWRKITNLIEGKK